MSKENLMQNEVFKKNHIHTLKAINGQKLAFKTNADNMDLEPIENPKQATEQKNGILKLIKKTNYDEQ